MEQATKRRPSNCVRRLSDHQGTWKSAGLNAMEPFTLTIWLWMGARFEQTQIENMGRGECVERLMTIRGDRGSRFVKGQCIGAHGYILPRDRQPQICAFAACWQAGKRV